MKFDCNTLNLIHQRVKKLEAQQIIIDEGSKKLSLISPELLPFILLYIFLNGDVFESTPDTNNLKTSCELVHCGAAVKYQYEAEDSAIPCFRSAGDESIQISLSVYNLSK